MHRPLNDRIFEQEQTDLIIYSIREELLDRVMDEVYAKYMQKQSIKYTVHCAYHSLLQILSTEFFVHDKGHPFYTGHPFWAPDREPKPSPPDTWAGYNVPILPKPLPVVPPPVRAVRKKVSLDEGNIFGAEPPQEVAVGSAMNVLFEGSDSEVVDDLDLEEVMEEVYMF